MTTLAMVSSCGVCGHASRWAVVSIELVGLDEDDPATAMAAMTVAGCCDDHRADALGMLPETVDATFGAMPILVAIEDLADALDAADEQALPVYALIGPRSGSH